MGTPSKQIDHKIILVAVIMLQISIIEIVAFFGFNELPVFSGIRHHRTKCDYFVHDGMFLRITHTKL